MQTYATLQLSELIKIPRDCIAWKLFQSLLQNQNLHLFYKLRLNMLKYLPTCFGVDSSLSFNGTPLNVYH